MTRQEAGIAGKSGMPGGEDCDQDDHGIGQPSPPKMEGSQDGSQTAWGWNPQLRLDKLGALDEIAEFLFRNVANRFEP